VKVAIMAGLFAKWYMEIDAAHYIIDANLQAFRALG
jgi:hypothetical protein